MKKILSIMLILAMALGMLAGCVEEPETTAAANGLEDAKEYLYAMYKDDIGTAVLRDFTLVNVVMIDGVKYNVKWTADSDLITITSDGAMDKISFDNAPEEQLNINLTATISNASGETITMAYSRYVEAVKKSGVSIVDAPKAGESYKFHVAQNSVGKNLYFTGEMSGYYLATTEDPFSAVDVMVEEVSGGYHIYFEKDGAKTYIDIVERDGEENKGKVNVKLVAEPTCVFTWNETFKTFITNVAGGDWYLGCYNTYETISASSTSYIKEDNVDVSQFPARLATVNITPSVQNEPKTDVDYKFAVAQNNVGKNLYFTGEMSGYYLATTVNPGAAVNIRLEAVEGGYHIYFEKDGAKTYIDIVERDGEENKGKVNVKLVAEPTCVFTWNETFKTFITNVAGGDWYLGCYNTYETISASATSYIKEDNVDVSQFPARLAIVEGFMG